MSLYIDILQICFCIGYLYRIFIVKLECQNRCKKVEEEEEEIDPEEAE